MSGASAPRPREVGRSLLRNARGGEGREGREGRGSPPPLHPYHLDRRHSGPLPPRRGQRTTRHRPRRSSPRRFSPPNPHLPQRGHRGRRGRDWQQHPCRPRSGGSGPLFDHSAAWAAQQGPGGRRRAVASSRRHRNGSDVDVGRVHVAVSARAEHSAPSLPCGCGTDMGFDKVSKPPVPPPHPPPPALAHCNAPQRGLFEVFGASLRDLAPRTPTTAPPTCLRTSAGFGRGGAGGSGHSSTTARRGPRSRAQGGGGGPYHHPPGLKLRIRSFRV